MSSKRASAFHALGAGKRANKKPSKDAPEVELSEDADLMREFKAGFDNLRSLVTCRICIKLLFEPYTIACGHTFCYSCLCQWFQDKKNKKSCPECRSLVKHQPAPAYLVREMTEMFITRSELMLPEETTEEYRKWQKEEADIVERDKCDLDPRIGGLFKGWFKSKGPDLRPLRDDEDGVDRCPSCFRELEDGECVRCGLAFDEDGNETSRYGHPDFSDNDDLTNTDLSSSEELDGEIDMEDQDGELDLDYDDYDPEALGETIAHHLLPPHVRYAMERAVDQGTIASPYRRPTVHSTALEDGMLGPLDEESEEDDDDDVDGSIEDFLVRDDSDDSQPSSPRHPAEQYATSRRFHRRGSLPESLASGSHSQCTNNEDESDEGGAISSGRRRRPRSIMRADLSRRLGRRGPIVLSVSSDADEESQDVDVDTQALLQSGWSPLDRDSDNDDNNNDNDNDNENENENESENDDSTTTVGTSPRVHNLDMSQSRGSLTPSAEASAGATYPAPRVRDRKGRPVDLSRDLRRVSSSVSNLSTLTDEDGEADSDDSDQESVSIDQDGDTEMDGTPQRDIGIRNEDSVLGINVAQRSRGRSRNGAHVGNTIDLDYDSASDPVRPLRRRPARKSGQPEHDPATNAKLALPRNDIRETRSPATSTHLASRYGQRSRTPVIRPRPSNRNRLNTPAVPTRALSFSPSSSSSSHSTSPVGPIAMTLSSPSTNHDSPAPTHRARALQARNPWAGHVRPRQSSTSHRQQSSTATLRPRESR